MPQTLEGGEQVVQAARQFLKRTILDSQDDDFRIYRLVSLLSSKALVRFGAPPPPGALSG
jgi:hypothetical protein